MSEEENIYKLTARQKMIMYITTLAIVAFIYLAPALFAFIEDLPDEILDGIELALVILGIASPFLVIYAIWSIFSTAKLAISKDKEREHVELAIRMAQKQDKPQS